MMKGQTKLKTKNKKEIQFLNPKGEMIYLKNIYKKDLSGQQDSFP